MSAIVRTFDSESERVPFEPWYWPSQDSAAACWQRWARESAAWLAAQQADPREALVILPVGAVLQQARQAWAVAVGGWVPRIDTIAAVAAGMAWAWSPPKRVGDEVLPALTLDVVLDRLQAARSLGGEVWGRQWAQRDRRGFEFALDQVVEAAHTWLRRLQAVELSGRAAYLLAARELVAAGGAQGPGGRERLLLAWALEWAASTAEAGLATDLLFSLRPSAFMGVTAGEAVSPGTEGHLMLALQQHLADQGVPVRWICAQPGTDQALVPHPQPPVLVACVDAEDEAQQAAAQVLAEVNRARAVGATDPVALIALDRSLIRRVRAMLEGAGAQIADETGWRLSTTRAAAVLSRLIQASHPRATTDDLLDWLKSGWLNWPLDADAGVQTSPRPEGVTLAQAAGQLEVWCRRHGMLGAWSLQVPPADLPVNHAQALRNTQPMPQLVPEGRQALPASAAALWRWASQAVSPLQAMWTAKRPSLHEWLEALSMALASSGSLVALQADAAGELALQSLRMHSPAEAGEAGPSWQGLSSQTRLDGTSFLRWVGTVLEGTTFRPAAPVAAPDVVITPMARAVLRPFHAIVLPGSDERQLGSIASQTGWLGTRLREAMDLATPQSLRASQWDALQLLMTRSGVICLYRQTQGSEPLEPSAWLERWGKQAGVPIGAQADARLPRLVAHQPVPAPLPSLSGHDWALPERVTATSYEALRQCPYRFFATSVLGLREQEELDEGLDRSDYGNWLHEVLRHFHAQRQGQLAISTEPDDVRSWLASAAAVIKAMGLDRDSQRPYFLPFQADLDHLALAYVRWLRTHEDAGWALQDVEVVAQHDLPVGEAVSVQLHGQLDRVDARHADGQRQQFVLDYKTGSLERLKAKVAVPDEDTQLAFYAALSDPQWPVSAAYLHLDASGVTQVDHADVERSAQALLEGLSRDWMRLHQGAAMPALGEGAACNYCQARGLCRKDHWSNPELAP
jgi:ATP-dependent helicase/nuclease subunit B